MSRASWQLEREGGFGSPVVDGTLTVETSEMRPGYFRRNGLPYGEQARLTEYFELLSHPGGEEYLTVISVLEDPEYLAAPVITSSNFKREENGGKWSPGPCM